MKRILLILTTILASFGAFSQTATDFTCNDCTGSSHNLFSELDGGKVVVLVWVMPCSSCVGPTLTTYNVVNSINATYANRVNMYIVDDYANTSCSSLTSWCTSNGFTNTRKFSNAIIKISDYGTAGMPKIVVIGNSTHHVYYNANNTVNATLLNTAIISALEDFSVGIKTPVSKESGTIRCFPNPASTKVSLTFSVEKSGSYKLYVFNHSAEQMEQPETFEFSPGEHTVELSTTSFKNGVYFARLYNETETKTAKFVVSR